MVEAETDNCTLPITPITDEWFSYSARGEVTDVYESTAHSGGYYDVKQSYWEDGALKQLSNLPGLPAITYGGTNGLDGEGRVTQVTAGTGISPVNSVGYNNTDPSTSNEPLGALLSVNLGTTATGQYDSDSFTYAPNTGDLTNYTFNVNGQTDVGQLTWNTDGSLQKLQVTDNIPGTSDSQTCNYTHDDLTRIATANCGTSQNQTFSYDPFGNITKAANPGIGFSVNYSTATNRITTSGYTYDSNGNLLSDATGSHQYSWDAEGSSVCIDGVVLTYDALGRVVEQARGGTCANPGTSYQQIVYGPGGGKLALMNGQTLTKAFVPLPGGVTAVYNSSGLQYYRHTDWLGSSRLASTPARTVYSETGYAPFGENYAGAGTTDLSFTGQNQDTVPGLYDFMFREYSPNQGRWISPDPAGLGAVDLDNPQSWNRYSYGLNNPCVFTDPLGLTPCTIYVSGPQITDAAQKEAQSIFDAAGVNLSFGLGPNGKADFNFENADLRSEGAFGDSSHPVIQEDFANIVNYSLYTFGDPSKGPYAHEYALNRAMVGQGRVLAHEIGHKFLGPHAADGSVMGEKKGIMRGGDEIGPTFLHQFNEGDFVFTTKQAARIRKLCNKLHPPVPPKTTGHGRGGEGLGLGWADGGSFWSVYQSLLFSGWVNSIPVYGGGWSGHTLYSVDIHFIY